MALGVNARTAFSLLFPPILDEFGWQRGVTAGAFSFGFLVAAPLTPLLGRLVGARGPRVVMELGVAVMAARPLLRPAGRPPGPLDLTVGVPGRRRRACWSAAAAWRWAAPARRSSCRAGSCGGAGLP